VLAFGANKLDGTTDGKVLPKPVIELMGQTGGTVPVLLGNGREEWSVFALGSFPDPMSWDLPFSFSGDFALESNS
jgi:hypothetical protein